MEERLIRSEVAAELSRRQFIQRAGVFGAGALIASAMPLAARMAVPGRAKGAVLLHDATMQAFYDTMIPGRPATTTDGGNEIHPRAIAGVDPDPGAVEADALMLGQNPKLGFTALEAPFLAEVEALAVVHGGDFLTLAYDEREAVCLQGLAFSNPTRAVWEAAAAVAFTAFCAAATQRDATSATASGYAVMGHPGTAPQGYRDFSYGRELSSEHKLTSNGSLP
jgi:hypothetical protein